MSTLVLAPHNDDETLWCAFSAHRERAHVVTVLRSFYQAERWPAGDFGFERREAETEAACAVLGASCEQWKFDDRNPEWSGVEAMLRATDGSGEWDWVYAPLPEPADGHEHHDKIGRLAMAVFGLDRLRLYPTYTRAHGRTTIGDRVDPAPAWIATKHRALACYASQMEHWLCRPHFLGSLDEYLVTP